MPGPTNRPEPTSPLRPPRPPRSAFPAAMSNSHSHGAQVPESAAQVQLFGANGSNDPPSPVSRALYGNGGGLHRNQDSLLELDKALNYEVRVVAGNSNMPLAQEIARHLRVRITEAEVSRFSDGEIRVSIGENVRGKDVFLIQSTSPPVNDNIMELLVILDALKRASAKRVTAVIPYYGYGRQDRKVAPRVPITARLVADLITTAGAHRVLAFELHAGQIQGFFNIPVDHMFAMPVFENYIQSLDDPVENPVVVSPDAGGVDRARALARRLDAGLAIIDKRRSGPNVAHVMHVIGDVAGRDCIIVDDMVDTGGTLTKAAQALKDNGARRVKACCIHAVLSGPAIQRIKESCIEELIITNTIQQLDEKKLPMITCLSVGSLMAETIRRVHREESVSTLFDD